MKKILTLLFLSVLLITLTACGGSSDTSDNSGNTTGTEQTADEPETFEVGKEYTIDDVVIKLDSVSRGAGLNTNVGTTTTAPSGKQYLLSGWMLLNDGDSDLALSTENFECYVDNTLVDTSPVTFMLPQDMGFTGLDTLAPGREYVGGIVYEIPETFSTVELVFKPNMFTDNNITWKLTPDQIQTVQ